MGLGASDGYRRSELLVLASEPLATVSHVRLPSIDAGRSPACLHGDSRLVVSFANSTEYVPPRPIEQARSADEKEGGGSVRSKDLYVGWVDVFADERVRPARLVKQRDDAARRHPAS